LRAIHDATVIGVSAPFSFGATEGIVAPYD
jgi:hypothetical protein